MTLCLSKPKRIISALFFVFILSGNSFAFEDGFGQAKKIESKYFIVYYAPQIDLLGLSQQLNISPADKFLIGAPLNKSNSADEELATNIDALFMRVSDILDMHLYSFNGSIKICRDSEQLKRIYKQLFDKELTSSSFYVYDLNTIYISPESFKREILGHEMAHTLISRYFAVSPSVKVQEVLAGYVEYQLRKPNL